MNFFVNSFVILGLTFFLFFAALSLISLASGDKTIKMQLWKTLSSVLFWSPLPLTNWRVTQRGGVGSHFSPGKSQLHIRLHNVHIRLPSLSRSTNPRFIKSSRNLHTVDWKETNSKVVPNKRKSPPPLPQRRGEIGGSVLLLLELKAIKGQTLVQFPFVCVQHRLWKEATRPLAWLGRVKLPSEMSLLCTTPTNYVICVLLISLR